MPTPANATIAPNMSYLSGMKLSILYAQSNDMTIKNPP